MSLIHINHKITGEMLLLRTLLFIPNLHAPFLTIVFPFQTPSSEEKPKLNRGTPSFRNYLQRAGPQALGSKEIPEVSSTILKA